MKTSAKIGLAAAAMAAIPLPLGHSGAAQAQNYGSVGGRVVVRERSRQSINEEDYQRGDFRRNRNGGYQDGDGCYGYGCDWDEDDDDHHAGAALAVGAVAGALVTSAANNNHDDTTTVVYSPAASIPTGAPALGIVVSGLPGGCSDVTVDRSTFQQCGSVWFQPHYVGSALQYTVVAAPR
jgi:hypothetical protein